MNRGTSEKARGMRVLPEISAKVTTSGQYPFVNGMTVETAVAIAAGFGPRAARDYAVLTRDAGGNLVSGIVPMTYPVRPGDTIVIKERFFLSLIHI